MTRPSLWQQFEFRFLLLLAALVCVLGGVAIWWRRAVERDERLIRRLREWNTRNLTRLRR